LINKKVKIRIIESGRIKIASALTDLIPHLHQALTRISGQSSIKNKISLSTRQREVLNWIKHGKSSWDISVILGISERTVKFHAGTIMQKLDVVTSTQALHLKGWGRQAGQRFCLRRQDAISAIGDRLSPRDKKQIARDIASSDPEYRWTEESMAEKLGIIRPTVNTWISDIRARRRAGREAAIGRLSRLGRPQEQIAEVVDLSRNRVSEIVGNANFGEIDTLLSQGRDIEKGANLEAKNEESYMPLTIAADYGNEKVVELLIEKGADLEAKVEDDWTALMEAAYSGHTWR